MAGRPGAGSHETSRQVKICHRKKPPDVPAVFCILHKSIFQTARPEDGIAFSSTRLKAEASESN
jgi:hypothetical protein